MICLDISLSGTNEFGTLTANAIEVSGLPDISRATGMLYGASLERVEINGCGVTYRQRDGTLKQCPQRADALLARLAVDGVSCRNRG